MKKGLRRAGIVGLSTVVAGSMMTSLAGPASALPNDYTALSTLNVTQGGTNQAAGSLTLDFANSFTTNATQTFTIAGNTCATAANIAAATEFAAIPTAAITGPFLTTTTNPGTAPKPTITTTLGSSSTQCATAGITDVVTLTIPTPSTGTSSDWFKYTLSNIRYNVGATATPGVLNVGSAGFVTPAVTPQTNATVVNSSYSVAPVVAAQLSSTGNTLGTASFVESTAGAFFPASSTRAVVLPLSAGTYTTGLTPTITVPAGYTATAGVFNGGLTSFTFSVTAPATVVKATVTVAGLKLDAPGTAQVVTINATVNAAAQGANKVANVLDFAARTGGATRYETAAALFTSRFGPAGTNVTKVVLARGDLYPDALSANYLAGKLATGTLLTTPSTLSQAARLAILGQNIATVYITGGTGAVSQAVQDQIQALHVGNVATAANIIVVRLGGADRYATNLLVNENAFTAEPTVLLASGANFPDALAFGPIAAGNTYPLILTAGTTLGSHEMAQLSDFSPTNVVIGGGTGVVSLAIETQLKAAGYTVLRLAGADRTLTAAAIANWATVGEGVAPFTAIRLKRGFASDTTYIATGNLFPDSLAAGPVAGALNRVILLTYSGLGAGIPSYLGPKVVGSAGTGLGVSVLHALGLTGAVSPADMKLAAASIETP